MKKETFKIKKDQASIGKEKVVLKIKGMSSPHCAGIIKKVLEEFRGIEEVAIDFANEKTSFIYSPKLVSLRDVKIAIEKAGYKVFEEREETEAEIEEKKLIKMAKLRAVWALVLSVPLMATMALMYLDRMFFGQLWVEAILSFIVVYILGWKAHVSALRAIRRLYANMDVLISLGTSAAWLFGVAAFFIDVPVFFEIAAFIMAFQLLGRYLEEKAKGKTSEALRELLELGAKTARILVDDQEKEIPVEELRVGDIILVRPGEKIPTDGKIIILDKTGTLTKGQPAVTDIKVFEKETEEKFLQIAASVEKNSEHPLAQAIVKEAENKGMVLSDAKNFKAVFGKGIMAEIEDRKVLVGRRLLMEENNIDISPAEEIAGKLEEQGKTAMLLAQNNKILGVIAVADTLKDETKTAIEQLHKMGFKTIMLTGDNERTAKAIAKTVGIDDVIAEVLPDEKVSVIKKLQKEGEVKVAMVGDGINDAPALTQADVGIAIGSGSDIAIEAGEITLVRGELDALVDSIKLSRATFRTIRQNLFWAFFYNVVAIPVAAFGVLATMLGPIIAAGAMAFSSLSVVLNSLRLKRMKLG